MKIMIIRHAEPDYSIDSLTEKGWREAEFLAEYLKKRLEGQVHFYTSPYGRASDTASVTLRRLGRTAETLHWLREFDHFIWRPDDKTRKRIPWDWLPQDWTADPRFYQADNWAENELMADGNIGAEYRNVAEQLDSLLAQHGYRREGNYYRVEKPNHDTIVLFCHFGVASVLLSHLWGVSPMVVWHGFCAQPSSVTTLVTEERREGIALFRMLSFGETAHLYVHDEEPSFAARFCECFEDETRHD
jgi:probable phosphoglycerate mutase